MPQSYDLTQLDENSFEHLANFLALQVLGAGHTGFGPGADGGRDGYFEGEAPYPSVAERWSGRWYVQAKFHRPHLSANPQKWLLQKIGEEIKLFNDPEARRFWPDIWIIVTNIEPSGSPQTGAFDRALTLVRKARPDLATRFHIWGGQKVLHLLSEHPNVAAYYGHFLTPGHVLTRLYESVGDAQASTKELIRYLTVTQFNEQQHTKLEQAGSTTDARPGIQRLFTDLPFFSEEQKIKGMGAEYIARTAAQNHIVDAMYPATESWGHWRRHPGRARVWFIKGGPGQGKSTITQFACQVQRAALMLGADGPSITPQQRSIAKEVRERAQAIGVWPTVPRIPVSVELKAYAQWYGQRSENDPKGMLTYVCERVSTQMGQTVHPGTVKRALRSGRWLFIFDGLDEVPSDVKDAVASEVILFIDDLLVGCESDAFTICTSRPQGYSGQFGSLECATITLSDLSPDQALACAKPVLEIDRGQEESQEYLAILSDAITSQSVREIMTTPLQAHIMAVVVRDGGRPPERKWHLFSNFYHVIKKREANRNLPNVRLSKLLREGDKLLKALHNRIGFELHARAETSDGAQTSLKRDELRRLVEETVSALQDTNISDTVATLMEATTERLVLVSTPESGEEVRFDIRPLQEFFAAEYLYERVEVPIFTASGPNLTLGARV